MKKVKNRLYNYIQLDMWGCYVLSVKLGLCNEICVFKR